MTSINSVSACILWLGRFRTWNSRQLSSALNFFCWYNQIDRQIPCFDIFQWSGPGTRSQDLFDHIAAEHDHINMWNNWKMPPVHNSFGLNMLATELWHCRLINVKTSNLTDYLTGSPYKFSVPISGVLNLVWVSWSLCQKFFTVSLAFCWDMVNELRGFCQNCSCRPSMSDARAGLWTWN